MHTINLSSLFSRDASCNSIFSYFLNFLTYPTLNYEGYPVKCPFRRIVRNSGKNSCRKSKFQVLRSLRDFPAVAVYVSLARCGQCRAMWFASRHHACVTALASVVKVSLESYTSPLRTVVIAYNGIPRFDQSLRTDTRKTSLICALLQRIPFCSLVSRYYSPRSSFPAPKRFSNIYSAFIIRTRPEYSTAIQFVPGSLFIFFIPRGVFLQRRYTRYREYERLAASARWTPTANGSAKVSARKSRTKQKIRLMPEKP